MPGRAAALGAFAWLLAAVCACASAPSEVELTTTGDASAERATVRCGASATAATSPCPRAACAIAPAVCQDDRQWVDHRCRTSSDCEDRGDGEPYCISTGRGPGCICVQRCAFHEQCGPGRHCTCEVGEYGLCVPGDPPDG